MSGDPGVETVVELQLDLRVYRLTAIKKAAYRLANRFTASFEVVNDETVRARLEFRRRVSVEDVEAAKRAFHQELLDQDLRQHVADETSAIRTLILAQAFSRTNLIGKE